MKGGVDFGIQTQLMMGLFYIYVLCFLLKNIFNE